MRKLMISLAGIAFYASAAHGDSLPWTQESYTNNLTVTATMKELKSRPEVSISQKGTWTVAEDEENRIVWSFPPKGHPAYPSVVKRMIVQENGKFLLKMHITCEAAPLACAELAHGFDKTNETLAQKLNAPEPVAAVPLQPTKPISK